MAAIPRKAQKVFGSTYASSPSGNIAQIGSTAGGSPVYSSDLDTIQSLTAFLNGFASQTVKNSSPVLQEFNALMLMLTQQIAYLLQNGIPEWLTSEPYFNGNVCRVGSVLYTSLTDNNTGHNPTTDTNNWTPTVPSAPAATPAYKLPAAWVNFNGNDGSILGTAFNVSSVYRSAAGCYTITFTSAMPNANYAMVATCGATNSGSRTSPAGNNNSVSRDAITTTTQVSVWIPKPNDVYGEDADIVSVLIFAHA